MPTGYTAILEDKPETTFAEFAWRCARAFGALIELRDEPMDAPIPKDFVVSDWYRERVIDAEEHVRELEVMTLPEARDRAETSYQDALKRHEGWIAETNAKNATYDAMAAKVEAWQPPTPEHVPMKEFMLQQLEISKYSSPGEQWRPKRLTADEWLAKERTEAKRNLQSVRETLDKEMVSVAQRNAWVSALRRSLAEGEQHPASTKVSNASQLKKET